jgi:hypothetical protein
MLAFNVAIIFESMKADITWICDTCGELIEEKGKGWVEWLVIRKDKADKPQGRGLRLVHHGSASPHGRCQYDGSVEYRRDGGLLHDVPLQDFLGPDGLMRLLSLLAKGELPKDEVLEMIKRLHIPGYEHARKHFRRAIAEGVFEPNTMKGYYWQRDIEAVLEFIREDDR